MTPVLELRGVVRVCVLASVLSACSSSPSASSEHAASVAGNGPGTNVGLAGAGGAGGSTPGAAGGSGGLGAAGANAGPAPSGGIGGTPSGGVGGESMAGPPGAGAGALGGAGGSGAAGAAGSGGSGGSGANSAVGPCDIYRSGGTPCVAAHSTVRALFGAYDGDLYQVRRSSDDTTREIATSTAGGYADGAAQDAFCADTMCVITVVYDQSGNGNDLWYQGSSAVPGSTQSHPAIATTEALTVGGSKVYSLYINPGNSYWRDGSSSGVPTGSEPEGLYMVTSGTHVNGGCCFDYGNSETTRTADAAGAMDAINFSTQCWFGGCSGSGPWVQADLEWGLYPGGSQMWNPNQRAFSHDYVTALLKNDGTTKFALKGGSAQSGTLTTLYEGMLPGGYSPMKKQGAIILGSGGDCCKPDGGANLSAGTFYEGAVVSGYPTDATDEAVQSNIVAAGYAK